MKEQDNKNSIWQQILKEANNQKQQEETHIFIFGDKNSGKRSLIKSVNKDLYLNYDNEERTLPQIDEYSSRFSFVEYKYLNVKKINDTENGKGYINIYNIIIELFN